jgi:hypothetical protein
MDSKSDQDIVLSSETLELLKERTEEIQFKQEVQSLDFMDEEDYAFYLAHGSFDR